MAITNNKKKELLLDFNKKHRTIKSVMDYHFRDLAIDTKLAKVIIALDLHFITKNSEHVNFFGSPLLGVHMVRWTDEETNTWLDDIISIDDIALKEDLSMLMNDDMRTYVIDPNFKVVSNTVTQTMTYILHRILVSKDLSPILKKSASESLMNLIHYRFITSTLANFFKYPADEAIAKTTFNSLSMKFLIKRLGSWGELVRDRSMNIISRNSIHFKTLNTYTDNSAVLYLITDIKTRMNAILKAQTKVYYDIKDNNRKIVTTTSLLVTADGFAIRDVSRTYGIYSQYMFKIVTDPKDFIRRDLLNIVLDDNPSANPVYVESILKYISLNYGKHKKENIKKVIEDVLLYSFNFIHSKRIKVNELKTIMTKLRAMFTGSRINDPDVLQLRELADEVVKEGVLIRSSKTPISPERTAILVYITMRALTKQHFTQ